MNWRSQSKQALRSEIEQFVQSIDYRLPTREEYGLPGNHKAALREVEQLLSCAQSPKDHGDRTELHFLKARILFDAGRTHSAGFAGRHCLSEATQSFYTYGANGHPLLMDLHWQRIKSLGEQERWLALERALSELIGSLAGTSRRHDRADDLNAARYARALCYQQRGLESGDPETARILLASACRDLEKVPEGDQRNQALDAVRERMASLQRENGHSEGTAPQTSPERIGLIGFQDFPQSIRDLFLNGPNLHSSGRFFAEKSPSGILYVLALFLFFGWATAFGLGGIFGFPSLLGLLATVPLVITIGCSIKILRSLSIHWKKKKAGAFVYGFLIDQEKLAIRTLPAFSDYTYFYGKNCVLLPLDRIHSTKIALKPIYAMAGRMVKAKELVIAYRDEQDETNWVHVPDRFVLPVTPINDLLHRLNHDLVGTWKDPYGRATIRFDQDSGTFTEPDGNAYPFLWREIEGGAIELIPLDEGTEKNRLQPDLYHFEVRPNGGSFELEFFEGFGGTTVSQMNRDSKVSDSPMDPARVARRLHASEPLPALIE